jgi:hypothetical protein
LEDENKSLKSEIADIKTNLRINKEIIQGMFSFQNIDDQSNFYISKLKEEITILTKQCEKVTKEREEIRAKV